MHYCKYPALTRHVIQTVVRHDSVAVVVAVNVLIFFGDVVRVPKIVCLDLARAVVLVEGVVAVLELAMNAQ
jgi:hypothetical protein